MPRRRTSADLIFLTVKPQALIDVLNALAGRLRDDQVVISIVAGAGIATLERGLGHTSIVRVMPNTPAQIGRGHACLDRHTRSDQRAARAGSGGAGCLGEELYVDEEKYVDMATALSGTGPTYVFLMMEALIDAGVHMGFPRRIAEQIVLQTVGGSVDFARARAQAHGRAAEHGDFARAERRPRRSTRWKRAGCALYSHAPSTRAYLRTQTLAAEQERRMTGNTCARNR